MRDDTPCGTSLLGSRRDAWWQFTPTRWRAANANAPHIDLRQAVRTIHRPTKPGRMLLPSLLG